MSPAPMRPSRHPAHRPQDCRTRGGRTNRMAGLAGMRPDHVFHRPGRAPGAT